jgi:hypothetical protein
VISAGDSVHLDLGPRQPEKVVRRGEGVAAVICRRDTDGRVAGPGPARGGGACC